MNARSNRAGGGSSRWEEVKRRYTRQTLHTAQSLRQTQTDAEGLLWRCLRDKQLDGHKFRRQQPIGPYVVDFVCMFEKLVIELDGGGHADRQARDRKREAFLQEQGYCVLRFWNNEVFENCLGVLETVWKALTPHRISHRLTARLLRLPLKGGVVVRVARPPAIPAEACSRMYSAGPEMTDMRPRTVMPEGGRR